MVGYTPWSLDIGEEGLVNKSSLELLKSDLEKVDPDTIKELDIAKKIVNLQDVTKSQLENILEGMLPYTKAYSIIKKKLNKIHETSTKEENEQFKLLMIELSDIEDEKTKLSIIEDLIDLYIGVRCFQIWERNLIDEELNKLERGSILYEKLKEFYESKPTIRTKISITL